MTTPALLLILFLCAVSYVSTRSAYSEGVVDGYGYCLEPKNPDYWYAGLVLRKINGAPFRDRQRGSVVVTVCDNVQRKELEQRIDWIMRRCEDARRNFDQGILRPGLEQQDFNGFMSGIEWIASGQAGESHNEYPEIYFVTKKDAAYDG